MTESAPSTPDETIPAATILDDGMERSPERKEVTPDHIKILNSQIESGETSHFDDRLIDLIKEINGNDDKSAIVRTLIDTGVITLKSLGSKAIGILGAMEAGAIGSKFFTQQASQYLSDRFVLDSAVVKTIPGNTLDAVKEAADSAANSIDSNAVEAAKMTANQVKGFFKGALDLVTDNVDPDVIEAGRQTAGAIKGAVSEGAAFGVDTTVEGINHAIVNPAIEGTSHLAGWASYLPSAAIGYFLTSGFVGGATGVFQEMRQENSFSHFKELIDTVNSFDIDNNPEVFENDPRIRLVVEFNKISNSSDKTKYHFTKQEWLQFAAAVREAKCSLLRSKTRAAQIIDDEERPFQERKQRSIDNIILNTQAELAAADRDLAMRLLVQFDTRLTEEMGPLEKEVALENMMGRKILKYSKTFVKSGINATGLPMLWRGFKASAKFAAKVVLPI